MNEDLLAFRVATFNIRNTNDRYDERRALLPAAFASLDADIAALQEAVFEPEHQPRLLASGLPQVPYQVYESPIEEYPNGGNAILCRVGEVLASERLRLSGTRNAIRVLVLLPRNMTMWFATTHLHHLASGAALRLSQARALIEWMDAAPAADGIVVCGDFNGPPSEPAYAAMRTAGYRSAFAEVNGREPYTWPSGIQAPTADLEGEPSCMDYIWLRGRLDVSEAALAANEPAPNDPTLYASDHFAITATLRLATGSPGYNR